MGILLRPSDAVNLAQICDACNGDPTVECSCEDGWVYDSPRKYLSHTRIGIMLACQRKYDFTYNQRLERIDRGPARELGAAFQKAIEFNDPQVGFDEILAKAADLTGGAAEYDKLRIQAHTVRAGARLYLSLWKPPAGEKREVPYLVRLRNPWTGHYSNTFDLKGYADAVTDHGGHLEIVENKFVGQISPAQVRKLVLDRQVTLEAYGLWRATGKAVREVRYRYIRKPSIKHKQGESVNDFLTRLEEDYASRPEFYSAEEPLFRTDEDLLRVEAELWTWAQQLRDLQRQRLHPRNTSSCDDFGGCDYLPKCCGEPDADGLFRVREDR